MSKPCHAQEHKSIEGRRRWLRRSRFRKKDSPASECCETYRISASAQVDALDLMVSGGEWTVYANGC